MPPSHSIHLFETRQPPFSAQWETQEKGRAEREGERRYGGNWLLYAFFTVGHEREKKRKEKRRTRKKWDGSSLSCFCFRSPGMGCCCWWKEWRRAQIARRKRNIGWRRRRRRWTGLWEGEKERNKSGGKLYTSCYTCYTDILPFPSNLQLPFVGRVEGNGGRLRLHTYTLLLFHWKRKKRRSFLQLIDESGTICVFDTGVISLALLSSHILPGAQKLYWGRYKKRREPTFFFAAVFFDPQLVFFFRTQLRTSIDGPLLACLPTRKMLEGDIADHF